MLGVSVPTVRLWADSGRVPCHRTAGGHRRFEVEELRVLGTQRRLHVDAKHTRSQGQSIAIREPDSNQ